MAGRAPQSLPWPKTVVHAWKGRCPRCGDGPLFQSRFRLRLDCGSCGLIYRPEQGGMTGQMYLSAAVTEVVALVLAAGLWFGTGWSVPVTLAVCVPFVAAFSFWFLPKGMALWVAIDYLTDRHDAAWTPKD